jgi:L-iditol 2-dehydrogenase
MGSFVDGGFAQFVRVPSHLVHRIPDTLSLQEAALCEPLACATHLLLDPPIVNAGDRVLVTGPGPMGLLLAQVARSAGAIVTLSGLAGDAGRLVIASSMGFTVSQGSAATDYDVVLECSGTAGGARAALEAVRKGGRYVSVGIHGRDVSIPFDLVLYKELTVTSGFAATSESWRRAMSLLSRGLIDLAPMISSVWSLRHWDEVIDSLRAGQGMKILFDPRLDDAAGESGANAQ